MQKLKKNFKKWHKIWTDLKADQVLSEHPEVLDGELPGAGTLDVDHGVVLLVQVALPVAELVAQELPVQRAGVGRLPRQEQAVRAGVVGAGDGGLPAGHLPQGDHVVALVALLAQTHTIDRHHLEAVDAEGVEAHHAVHGAVVARSHGARIAPVRLLSLPHLQLSDEWIIMRKNEYE